MKRSATPRSTPDGFEPGSTVTRFASLAPGSYNATSRTVEGVFSTGARVRRWGVVEELSMDAGAIDLARASAGRMTLLWNHNQDQPIGVIESARLENGQLVGRIRFADTDEGRRAEGQVARGELSSFSIGYRVSKWTLASVEDDTEIWRADAWELLEVSLVSVPADANAAVRSAHAGDIPTHGHQTPAHSRGDADMRPNDPNAAVQPAENAAAPVTEQRAAPQAPAPAVDTQEIVRAERTRVAALEDIASRSGMPREALQAAINEGTDVDTFRARAFDHMAAEAARTPTNPVHVLRDETETRRLAMTEALAIRLGSGGEVSDQARGYMDYQLADLAAESVGHRGRMTTTAAREEVMRRAFHTTSDFPIIFENALNRALQGRYAVQSPTYRRISRQRSYVDFRPHSVVRPGDFPMLSKVNETGEIKAGTFTEAKETTHAEAYGVTVALSRQMLVNDTLGAINQVLADQALTVARFEEKTFFEMFLSNSGAGPTLLEVNRAVFHTSNGNLATASAITVATLGAGRAKLRKMKTQSGHPIDVAPTILLCGPDQLLHAEMIVTPVLPGKAADVNPFAGAMRTIETAMIEGDAWYLFVDPAVLPCFEWGLLEGYTAPRMRMEEPFGVQGVKVSLEHDFGCGAIDYRGAFRNPGAQPS